MKKSLTLLAASVVLLTGCATTSAEPSTDTVELAGTDGQMDACLEAIDAAEEIGTHMSTFIDIAMGYMELIGPAYEAGLVSSSATTITDKMAALTKQNNDLTTEVGTAVDAFNTAKAVCRG